MADMEALLQQADKRGLWLHCPLTDQWFSPDEFRKAVSEGRFSEAGRNWELRPPALELNRLRDESQRAILLAADFVKRVENWQLNIHRQRHKAATRREQEGE